MQFLARVAGNTLDIVLRELSSGSNQAAIEQPRYSGFKTALAVCSTDRRYPIA